MNNRKMKRDFKKSGYLNFYELCLAMSKFQIGRTKKFPHVKYAKARYEEDRCKL